MLPIKVLARTDLTPIAKLVFAVVVDAMRDKQQSWPSVPTIARTIAAGRASVLRAIRALEAAGLIVVDRSEPGQSNLYRLSETSDFLASVPAAKCDGYQSQNETGTSLKMRRVPVSKRDGYQSQNETGPVSKRDGYQSQNETLSIRSKTDERKDEQGGPAAPLEPPAGSVAHLREGGEGKIEQRIAACLAVLTQAGIGEPVRSELARHVLATPQLLGDACAHECTIPAKVGRCRGALERATMGAEVVKTSRRRIEYERREHAEDERRIRMELEATKRAREILEQEPERAAAAWQQHRTDTGNRFLPVDWRKLPLCVLDLVEPGMADMVRREACGENGQPELGSSLELFQGGLGGPTPSRHGTGGRSGQETSQEAAPEPIEAPGSHGRAGCDHSDQKTRHGAPTTFLGQIGYEPFSRAQAPTPTPDKREPAEM